MNRHVQSSRAKPENRGRREFLSLSGRLAAVSAMASFAVPAVHAAEKIQFKPAQKDGQPADFEAVLHIEFQLAS